MKQERTITDNTVTDNTVFKYAFAGVLFFIAALGYVLTHFAGIISLELSTVIVGALLGLASVTLLYMAIKNDKERLQDI